MFKRSTALAAAFALSASSVFAGGLSPEIIESTDDEAMPAAGPSIEPTYIVLGIIAALLIAAAIDDDDDDSSDDDGGDTNGVVTIGTDIN